jgi:SpoVK/Ycf46/Vps4 family AAA+-type ATPase
VNATYPALEEFPAYQSAAEELTGQLWRLQLLLARAVMRFRERHAPDQRRGLSGVAIFDDEVDAFLNAVPQWSDECESDVLVSARLRCDLRAQAGVLDGVDLPLERIRSCFELNALQFDALLLCLAAELHPGYGRVFAYLNNDLTRQRPSLALLVDILSEGWTTRLETRRALGSACALQRFALLVAGPGADELGAELAIDPSLVEFVLAGMTLRQEDATPPVDDLSLDELLVSQPEAERLRQVASYLTQHAADSQQKAIIVLSGAPGAGKRTTARALSREIGERLRLCNLASLSERQDLVRHARDARLAGAIPCIRLQSRGGDERGDPAAVLAAIEQLPCQLAFVVIDADDAPRLGQLATAHILGVHLATPPATVRRTAWKRALREHGTGAFDEDVQTLAAVYPFAVGRIYASVREARLQLDPAAPQTCALGIRELAAAARNQTSHSLDKLAQPLPLRFGWSDIVLPDDERARLQEIADAVRNRDRVMEQWGFGEKISAGPGVNAIFFGPSGTGKTMAASILAAELGMAIYRVDLSRVVSKYIGETEQNLDALFEEARRSFALLFFDEAEAIFGKRSEVKDAHDRYANIEVAYLLQRMETFEGVAILATNLRKHMDNAFLRRLQFAVEFPLPAFAQRLQIWRQVWPASAELSDDIDLEFMANRFELSGGHIRNVAMMAAYLACEDGKPIGMAHLVAATRREFQKLGRGARVDD